MTGDRDPKGQMWFSTHWYRFFITRRPIPLVTYLRREKEENLLDRRLVSKFVGEVSTKMIPSLVNKNYSSL